MHNLNIAEDLRNFITENYFFGQPNALNDGDSFLDSGILDSTGVLQLIAFLQQQYGFKVEDEEIVPDNLDSIAKVIAYVHRKRPREAEQPITPVSSDEVMT